MAVYPIPNALREMWNTIKGSVKNNLMQGNEFGQGDSNPSENDQNNFLYQTLWANKDKDFVNRILYFELAPKIDYGDGNYATHKMMWGGYGNKNIVFPSIINQNGNLKELLPDEAFSHAIKNNEYIPFDSPEKAEWFSKNYKRIWR